MSSSAGECDSRELAALRASYKLTSTDRATPDRLGAFARRMGKPISDFGAHSKRWMTQFKRAMP